MADFPELTSAIASTRLAEVGPNTLEGKAGWTWPVLVWRQVKSPMVALLAVAGVVSIALGEVLDAGVIASIVVLNTLVGLFQEARAEQAIEALKAMTAPHARVRRDGTVKDIPASEVVPGDQLVLAMGDVVAADARVLDAHDLELDEASLTGESRPVRKGTDEGVFMGTHVVAGTARAVVLETGMRTEMGRIAGFLNQTGERTTPLQERLEKVGRTLVLLCLGVVGLVAVLGVVRGLETTEIALLALSLAVASIPEGLPVVVTVALALGVQRMVERHVLVRRLAAVEALGAVTVVCTDKTGTLTTGRMEVREIVGDPEEVLRAALGCVDATLDGDDVLGSPTEVAIVRAAIARGMPLAPMDDPRLDEQPFSSATKWMWVRHGERVVAKGAPDVLLPRCMGGEELASATDAMARRGLRTLAVAAGPEPDQLVAVGLLGIADPPRASAKEAIAAAHRAGIKTIMITGDHALTARAIAEELGLAEEGADLADRVHARATPTDKVEIVEAWRAKGAIVAMTGDGVNDAPALERAHVGIAMGRTGTEVTREAADVILTDDDYAHIVQGIREGRGIDTNIRKTLVYLLGGNVGELGLVVGALVLGLPTPLSPLHLLWINVVTDGLPALALSTDPAAPDALERPPRDPEQPVLDPLAWRRILTVAVLDASVTLGVFLWGLRTADVDVARTLAFSTLVVAEVTRAVSARHLTLPFWKHGLPVNRWLVAVLFGTLALQLLLITLPFSRDLLHLAPLTVEQMGVVLVAGLLPLVGLELSKRG